MNNSNRTPLSSVAKAVFTLGASMALLNACGSSGDTGSSLTAAGDSNGPVIRKLEITPDEVRDPRGCLNLPQLFNRLQQTPEGTLVREVTTNFRIGNPVSGSLRSNFVRSLALKAFLFNESSPSDLHRAPIEQVGCEKVVTRPSYGQATEAQIETWDETSLTLVYPSRREIYKLAGPTLLKIVRTGQAMDDCNRQRVLVPAETTTYLRWGTQESLEAQNENLEFNFVKVFTEALNESPLELGPAIRYPFNDESGTEVVQMHPELLRSLASTDETVMTKRCSELPDPTPTPAPTPVPTPRPPTAKPRSIIDIFWDLFS